MTFVYVILMSFFSFTGCGLLPKQVEPLMAPILHPYEPSTYENFKYATVKRGNITQVKTIYCSYIPTTEENLSFMIADKRISHLYVEVGDQVKKGDLIAQLDIGDMAKQITDLERDIKKTELIIDYTLKQHNLEVKKHIILYNQNNLSKTDLDNVIKNVDKFYQNTVSTLEDSLYISNKKLEQLKELLGNHRLYASMDGVITYRKDNLINSISKLDEYVIKIKDNNSAEFRADTKCDDLIKDGDKVNIKVNKSYLTAIAYYAVDGTIYFKPQKPKTDIIIGTGGIIEYILEEKKDILYLPSDAIHKMEGYYFVNYIDDKGMQHMKEVEIGLNANARCEILEGLELDDTVVY